MYKAELTITNKNGLHTRPVKEIVSVLQQYKGKVSFDYKNHIVDGKSILGILSLGIGYNQDFDIILDGMDGENFYKNKLEPKLTELDIIKR